MTQERRTQLFRRDGLTGIPYLQKLVAIDAIFAALLLAVVGVCLRILIIGRGRRLPFVVLLASSISYTISLFLVLVGNDPDSVAMSFAESNNLTTAAVFFEDISFPLLFLAIAAVIFARRTQAHEMAGRSKEPFNDTEIIVVLSGVAILLFLSIISIVHAGMNASTTAFILKIVKSPSTFDAREAAEQESIMRRNQVLTAGYVLVAARCIACFHVSFAAVYNFCTARRRLVDHVEAEKWMAYLLPPICIAYVVNLLWFTISEAPKLSFKIYKTVDDGQRANIADEVLWAAIPFLMSLVLLVVGVRRSFWDRKLDDGFVKMHDWPAAKRDPYANGFDAKLNETNC